MKLSRFNHFLRGEGYDILAYNAVHYRTGSA